MENNLPKGWNSPLLNEVVTIKSGNSKLTKKNYVSNGKYTAFSGSGPDGKTDFYEHEGDAIILSAVGARCGKCFRASGKWTAIANTSIIRAKIDNPDVYRYLFYMFNNENFWPKGGTGQPFVKSGFALKEMRIPFPPIPHQKRIADKLDTLLTKVKDAQSRLDKIPTILSRFRQSVLVSACSGELTKLWRIKNKQNSEWDIKKLRDLGEVTGGVTKNEKRKALKMQVPYLRVANVYENRLELGQVLKIGVTEKEFKRTSLLKGDLLFVEGNGSLEQIGRVALWDGSIKRCVHQNHLIKFRAGSMVDPAYVLLQMMAPSCRAQLIDKAVSTAGLHSLSISKISEVECLLPSIAEQKEIIRRVETLFDFVDQVKSRHSAGKAYADKLEQSILAKAFRGELVS